MQLSRTIIISLLESAEEFPVDFDYAWKWLEYNQKSDAKTTLKNNFIENVDFSGRSLKNPRGGRPSEKILLTIDCFKSFAMMANTDRGREVRRYFLECERQLRELQVAAKDNKNDPKAADQAVEDEVPTSSLYEDNGEPVRNISLPPLKTLTDACVFFFSAGEWLMNAKATVSAYRLFFVLIENQAYGDRPAIDELIKEARISRPSFYKAIKVLEKAKLLPHWAKYEPRHSPEKVIRDRLKTELGGRTEVPNEFGFIDLLTEQEVIEIKIIQDWKTAVGHVITKGQAYPQHSKRIHLFGKSDVNLEKITACCALLDVTVTFEQAVEVQPEAQKTATTKN